VAGKLVHFEIPAKDASRATKFYKDLFDWKIETFQGETEYHMVEGDPGGGIYPTQDDNDQPKMYFDTDDIDATIARVRELGGQADEKAPVPNMGWFAQCKDTEGNQISLWQSDESAPMPAGVGSETDTASN
jgi:predicted enzyme related to lactoylglutathione lyase